MFTVINDPWLYFDLKDHYIYYQIIPSFNRKIKDWFLSPTWLPLLFNDLLKVIDPEDRIPKRRKIER